LFSESQQKHPKRAAADGQREKKERSYSDRYTTQIKSRQEKKKERVKDGTHTTELLPSSSSHCPTKHEEIREVLPPKSTPNPPSNIEAKP
jgi:hypothetical protein